MKFVEVNEMPRVGHKRKELKARLDEFMRMRTKTVKVEWEGTYKTATSAQMNLTKCAKTWGLPIDVRSKNDEVYLIRRDM